MQIIAFLNPVKSITIVHFIFDFNIFALKFLSIYILSIYWGLLMIDLNLKYKSNYYNKLNRSQLYMRYKLKNNYAPIPRRLLI